MRRRLAQQVDGDVLVGGFGEAVAQVYRRQAQALLVLQARVLLLPLLWSRRMRRRTGMPRRPAPFSPRSPSKC
jgi:hypothetical protein